MKRLSWSKFFNVTALLSLSLAVMVASANGAVPVVDVNQAGARVPAVDTNTGAIKAWEGFQTTNYLSTEPYTYTPPTVGLAVGPVNVLTVVNRRLAMYDNPNAILTTGTPPTATLVHGVPAPTNYTNPSNPGNTSFISVYLPTSEALLDAVLGEAALNFLCPTQPQTTISCLIDNATARYDQLQGRFIIAFTVTDTGVQTIGSIPTQHRKASWVILISRFSQFPTTGQPGTSDTFIAARPGPAGGSGVTGGTEGTNWTLYYGGTVDGLGGPVSDTQGNINDIPGVDATVFDCSIGAIGSTNTVCYFPTGLRIGIDNDDIILTAPVVNVNFITGAGPQFAGTRVRVFRKGGGPPGTASGLYQKSLAALPLVAAAPLTPTPTTDPLDPDDYYDLFATRDPLQVTPLPATEFTGAFGWSPYTIAPPNDDADLAPVQAIFCEPARVRGRAAASYTNSMLKPTAATTSQTYLECIISTPPTQGEAVAPSENTIFIQPIQYIVTNFGFAAGTANVNAAIEYYPELPPGFDGTISTMEVATVPAFQNPLPIPQAVGTGPDPSVVVYVGDDRPHEVVMREGYLYDARVATDTALVITGGPGDQVKANVFYDILQKLSIGSATGAVNPVLLARWANTNAWAPAYEVPGNVTTQGQTSPINTFNWLEKLFVSTSYPQLAASDPRLQPAGTAGAPGAGTQSNCSSSSVIPNTVGGVSHSAITFVGLYDIHCGQDQYDTNTAFRDPVSGQLVTTIPGIAGGLPFVSTGVRSSASTDPNNGSLWNFGLYAAQRFSSIQGFGQLGTFVSNYNLAFPTTDPYGNSTALATDCMSAAACPFFIPVQVAVNQGLATLKADGTVGLSDTPTRGEMAKLTVLGMMDEAAITAFLQTTGGCTTSFADVASDCNGGVSGGTVPSGPSEGSYWRYIETMFRKRITTGCFANDAIQQFCPTNNLTRGQMAVFLIRAKFNNVYPSVISGCPQPQAPACPGITGGDNFGLTIGTTPYFGDEPATDPFFLYIQKMYELRITNGIVAPPGAPLYGPNQTLTRGQLLTFVVRAFFY